ncbi:hypothetical protein EYF80_006230 [Liparis tanakae]|uniref:Uncharacterized protein n=1 Tax=Liparis tanakae TaxID=230148 RepID=A0A4Z2J2J5_9TELE|nr:hypothetical protein EYF80_006230 [Liparis tanakae]
MIHWAAPLTPLSGALPVASGEKLLTEVTVADGGVSGGSRRGHRLLSRGLSVPPAPPGSSSSDEQPSRFSSSVCLMSCWTMSTFFPQSRSRGGGGDSGGPGEELSPSWDGLLEVWGESGRRGGGLSDGDESPCLSLPDATPSQSPVSPLGSFFPLAGLSSCSPSSASSSSLVSSASGRLLSRLPFQLLLIPLYLLLGFLFFPPLLLLLPPLPLLLGLLQRPALLIPALLHLQQLPLVLLQPAQLGAQRLLAEAPGGEVSAGQPGRVGVGGEGLEDVAVGSGVGRVVAAVRQRSEACVREESGEGRLQEREVIKIDHRQQDSDSDSGIVGRLEVIRVLLWLLQSAPGWRRVRGFLPDTIGGLRLLLPTVDVLLLLETRRGVRLRERTGLLGLLGRLLQGEDARALGAALPCGASVAV